MMIRGFCQYVVHAAVAVCALLCGGVAQAGDILLAATSGELWGATRSQLAVGVLRDAMYSAVDESTYRFRGSKSLTIARIVPQDITLHWDDEQLHVLKATSVIYNKGDNGPLEKAPFEDAVSSYKKVITDIMQTEPKVRKVEKKEAGVKPRAWMWVSEKCAVLLEAHSTGVGKRYVSEFIRMTVVPDAADLERGGADDAARRVDLKKNVHRDRDGSVWIEGVPMVDQGEKGYCVPAALSRVFAYYNMDGVDQHALAAICKSSGDEGTTIEAMSKALTSISAKFHMGVTSWRWFNKKALAKEYDKLAQKNGVRSGMLDTKLLLTLIKDKPSILKKGIRDISRYIDNGIPIVWGVMLGLYPEAGLPQSMGGHMRLIIGYNEPLQQIIYTDSWGAEHKLKAMPLAQACAISEVLYVLRPLR